MERSNFTKYMDQVLEGTQDLSTLKNGEMIFAVNKFFLSGFRFLREGGENGRKRFLIDLIDKIWGKGLIDFL